MVKELLPIVTAAAIWGQTWGGKTVRAQCANMAAVAVVELWYKHGARGDASEMLPGISEGQAHIPCFRQPPSRDQKTTLADALSRTNLALFHSLCPQANKEPVAILEPVLDVLLNSVQAGLDLTELDSAVEYFFTNG